MVNKKGLHCFDLVFEIDGYEEIPAWRRTVRIDHETHDLYYPLIDKEIINKMIDRGSYYISNNGKHFYVPLEDYKKYLVSLGKKDSVRNLSSLEKKVRARIEKDKELIKKNLDS